MLGTAIRTTGILAQLALFSLVTVLFADEKLDALIKEANYKDAVAYADKNLPAETRDVDVWVKVARAQEALGAKDKALAACQAAQKVNPSDAQVYLAFGAVYAADKKFQEALDNYQRCYVLDRSAVSAEGIATSAARLSQWDKARDAAESAIQLDSTMFESRLILAEIYLKDKDYKSAAAQLEVLSNQKPGEVKYWKQLAVCYDKTGDAKQLAQADRKIIELDKKDIPSRRRLAEHSLGEKDTVTAFEICKELAVLTPSDAKVFRLLYAISADRGNKKDAILYLKNYLVLDSTVAASHKALADLLYEQKDLDEALDSYRHALRLDPKIKGFYKKYEGILLQKKLEDEAVVAIRGAIAVGEADAASYTSLGDILKKRRDCAAAVKMYQEALKGDANNVVTLTSLGECQAQAGDVNGAIITYEQVMLMNPKAILEIKILGDLQMKAKKEESAVASYRKYIAKAPDDAAVAGTIGMYEFGKKQYKDAISHLEMVRDSKLQDVSYWAALGESYFRVADYKNAVAALVKARALKPTGETQITVLKLLGESYEKTGDDAKAAEAFEAYTGIPGVRDADAAYLKAYLREKSDKAGAVGFYQANTTVYPKDHRNFLRMGLIQAEDKASLAKAAAALSSASALIDSLPIVWEKLGEVYGKLGNEEREIAAYKKLLTLSPQHVQANKRVGTVLMKKGQIAPAISNLEAALAFIPKDVDVILLLADGYVKTKRPQQAADLLAKAKEQRPEDVALRLQLIETRKAAGQNDKVAAEQAELAELDKKIVAKNGKEIEARQRLAAYLLSKKDEKASDLYKELAILTPKDASVFKNLYMISLAAGNKKDATLYLKNYLVLDSSDASSIKALGDLLFEQKDFDPALEAYRKALRTDPKITGLYKNYETIVLKKGLDNEAIRVITGAIAAKEADAASYIALGDIYAKGKNHPGAIKMYQDAMKSDPKNVAVLSSLAECQAMNGDAAGAIITYEQVVLMNPTARKEYKALGDLQMQTKKPEDAIATYKKYLAKETGDAKIAKVVGLFEFARKQYAEAVKFLEMVRDAKEQDNDFFSALGQSYYRAANYAKASETLAQLQLRKPPVQVSTATLKLLGESYEKTGKDQKAAEAYDAYVALPGVRDADASYQRAFLREKADKAGAVKVYTANTKLFPKDHRNFLRLGSILSADKATYAQAAEALAATAALVDSMPVVWQTMAQVYGKLENEAQELAAYKKFLSFDSQNLEANRRVGTILLKKGQIAPAIANLETALAISPKDVSVMLMLSDAYLKTKRPEQAADLLAKATSISKDDPAIRMQLYALYKEIGKKEKAEAEIKGLVELRKENKYRTIYARDLIDQNRFDEALGLVKEINASDPANVDGLMLLAEVQRGQGKPAEAMETYKAVGFIKDSYVPAILGRGDAYLEMKTPARAQEFYRKASELDPQNAAAALGLAKCAKLLNNQAEYQKQMTRAKQLDPKIKAPEDAPSVAPAPAPAQKASPAPAATPQAAPAPAKSPKAR